MAAPLGWTVDETGGCAVVAVHGRLDLGGTPGLRTVLLNCLAEQPDGLLVDLSAVGIGDETAFAVLDAVATQAARWPGRPLLVCAPPAAVEELLGRPGFGRLSIYASIEDGRRAVDKDHAAVPSISDSLLPVAGAARHARNLATEACVGWGLPELVGPASLVVSELVANAVEHARTMMTVTIARPSRHVHIAVRDGVPREPVLGQSPGLAERGRGLMLVENVAAYWGWLPSRDGKVVWAALAV